MTAPDDQEPIAVFSDAVAWTTYAGSETKHTGTIEVYPNWIRVRDAGIRTWFPRENVREVHES